MDAIQKTLVTRNYNKKHIRRLSIWSIRWKFVDGKYVLANAKPCQYCKNIAIRYGITTTYYSNEEGIILKEKLENLKTAITPASVMHLINFYNHQNLQIKRSCC